MSKPLVFVLGVLAGVALSVAVVIGGLVVLGRQLVGELGTAPGAVAPAAADDSAGLVGTYACPKGCIYTAVELRDGGHAVVSGMGMEYATTFTRAGDRVYLASDKGDLGFRVVDASTLEGEGWAEGTYRRR
jgi:hypothetical protein